MAAYLLFPLRFLMFWFYEAPKEIIFYFLSLNAAFFQFFSLPLLLRTFFQPIKNEYRKGLIGFSIGMGMFVKSWIILFDLALLILLLAFEIVFILSFILLPFLTVALLFIHI